MRSPSIVGRGLGMFASIVSVAMTARYLGPGPYGELTIAMVFIGMWYVAGRSRHRHRHRAQGHLGAGRFGAARRVNSGISMLYCVPLVALAAGRAC